MAVDWAQPYLAAILAGDRRRAFEVVHAARAARVPMRAMYLEVFQPALREVGRLWQENRLTVAEEHLATAITQMAMVRIYNDLPLASAQPGRLLIAACADTERHEGGLRMVCDLAEESGWDAMCLGASVPLESLVAMVRERRPHAVALSASTAPRLPELAAMVEAMRAPEAGAAPYILVGGRPFLEDAGLAGRLGADATAADAAEAVERLGERFA